MASAASAMSSGLQGQGKRDGNERRENLPRKRKKYLGPTSTETMPRSSKWLYTHSVSAVDHLTLNVFGGDFILPG